MVTKKKKKLSQNSAETVLKNIVLNVYGPPGSGKTWCALTLSDKFRPQEIAKRGPKSKRLTLKNLIYVGWDPAGLAGLAPHNVDVEYSFEMNSIIADQGGDLLAAIRLVAEEINDIVYENESIIAIIHDTITMADKASLIYFNAPGRVVLDKNMNINTQAFYGSHLGFHREYQTGMTQLPDGIASVFLFHEKVIEDAAELQGRKGATRKQKTEVQNKTMGEAGVNILPHVTGNGLNYYTAAASAEMIITKKQVPGKRGVYERNLYPYSIGGHRHKNRFEHLLMEPQEPDLLKLIAKIRGE